MYEAVRLREAGATTPSRVALTASRYGFDGVVLLGVEPRDREVLAEISATYDIDVVSGVRLTPTDPGSAGGTIASVRQQVDVLVVEAETRKMARFVAQQDRVDVLSYPLSAGAHLPHTIAKTAREHGVYVEVDLSPVLRTTGEERAEAIHKLDRLGTIIEHYDIPFVATANARNHLELRAWRELHAVGELVGLSTETIETGLHAWRDIASRSRRARDDKFIEPGVRRSDHETHDR